MKNQLAALEGVNASHVFTEPVSPELVHIGYGPLADDCITYIRYSMPNDIALGERWREQLPLTILRVRDPDHTQAAVSPFEISAHEQKEANFDEHQLENDLLTLVNAVKVHWGQTEKDNSAPFRSLSAWVDLIGQHFLGYDGSPSLDEDEFDSDDLPGGPMNCLGDSQDSDYQISSGTYYLDDDQVIAVVGTLGTETGNATYTSLSVNWFPELVGVLNRDNTVLEKSAQKSKKALSDEELYTKFYVYYFARDCSGLYPWCQEISRTEAPRGDTIKILQRNDINPGSKPGPGPHKILNPIAIELDGRQGMRPDK